MAMVSLQMDLWLMNQWARLCQCRQCMDPSLMFLTYFGHLKILFTVVTLVSIHEDNVAAEQLPFEWRYVKIYTTNTGYNISHSMYTSYWSIRVKKHKIYSVPVCLYKSVSIVHDWFSSPFILICSTTSCSSTTTSTVFLQYLSWA